MVIAEPVCRFRNKTVVKELRLRRPPPLRPLPTAGWRAQPPRKKTRFSPGPQRGASSRRRACTARSSGGIPPPELCWVEAGFRVPPKWRLTLGQCYSPPREPTGGGGGGVAVGGTAVGEIAVAVGGAVGISGFKIVGR